MAVSTFLRIIWQARHSRSRKDPGGFAVIIEMNTPWPPGLLIAGSSTWFASVYFIADFVLPKQVRKLAQRASRQESSPKRRLLIHRYLAQNIGSCIHGGVVGGSVLFALAYNAYQADATNPR